MKNRGIGTDYGGDPGTRKSIGTSGSLAGFGASLKDRTKATDFTDLFVSPNDPPKKRENIMFEMGLLQIYTMMRNEFLNNHEYYNFIKDVSRSNIVSA